MLPNTHRKASNVGVLSDGATSAIWTLLIASQRNYGLFRIVHRKVPAGDTNVAFSDPTASVVAMVTEAAAVELGLHPAGEARSLDCSHCCG